MSQIRVRRVGCAAAVLAAAAAALPAGAQAALINLGSSLAAPATVAVPRPVDTAFWSTSVAGGSPVRAPQAGQVFAVRLRGCAQRGSGGQLPLTQFHFQSLTGTGATATIQSTSGPANLPICGGSVSGATVSTFHPVNLCVAKGGFVAFNDEGGGAAAFPTGVGYEVFAPRPGSVTDSFTGAGATNNGNRLRGGAHSGLELLMQVVLATGRNIGPACPR